MGESHNHPCLEGSWYVKEELFLWFQQHKLELRKLILQTNEVSFKKFNFKVRLLLLKFDLVSVKKNKINNYTIKKNKTTSL